MATVPYPETDATRAAQKAYQEAIQAHGAAVGALNSLRTTVQSGGDVEPSALTEAKALAEHAGLRVEAKHRAMAQARAQARTQALKTVATEVRGYDSAGAVDAILAALDSAEEALNEVLDLCAEHSSRIVDWHGRAGALLAETRGGDRLPSADQAGVGTHARPGFPLAVQVDNTVFAAFEPGWMLDGISRTLDEVQARMNNSPQSTSVDLTRLKKEVAALLKRTLPAEMPRAADRVGPAHFRDDE